MKRILFTLIVLKALTWDFSLQAQQWVTEIDSDRTLSLLHCIPVDNGDAMLSAGYSTVELQGGIDAMGSVVKVRSDGTYTRREIRKEGKKLYLLTATELDDGNYMVCGTFDDATLNASNDFFRHLAVMVIDSALNTVTERSYRVDTEGFEGFRPVQSSMMRCTKAPEGNVILGTCLSYFTPDQYGGKYESRYRFYELDPTGDTVRSVTQPQNYNGLTQSGIYIENLFPNPTTGGFTFVGWGNYSPSYCGGYGIWNLGSNLEITSKHPMKFGSYPFYFSPVKMSCEGRWYDDGLFLTFTENTSGVNTWDNAGWLHLTDTLAGKHASVMLPPTDSVNSPDRGCCTAYVNDSTIFAVTYCYSMNNMTGPVHTNIILLDKHLNILGRTTIHPSGTYCFPSEPVALNDGSVVAPVYMIPEDGIIRSYIYSYRRDDIEITWDVVDESSPEQGSSAYPNPASDKLHIPVNHIEPGVTRLRIISSDGMSCVDAAISTEGNLIAVDVGNLAPGIYVYQVVTNAKVNANGKFIKE